MENLIIAVAIACASANAPQHVAKECVADYVWCTQLAKSNDEKLGCIRDAKMTIAIIKKAAEEDVLSTVLKEDGAE